MPNHVGTAWNFNRIKSNHDGYFAGTAIKLDDRHVIVHRDTYDDTRDIRLGVDERPFHFNSAKQIDVHNPPEGSRKYRLKRVQDLGTNSSFALYKRDYFDEEVLTKKLEISDKIEEKGFVPPVLETNKSHLGDNCHLHSYSSGPYSGPGDSKLRDYVTVPVQPSRCDEYGHCTLIITGNGVTCAGLGDRGNPTYCGPDKKLTYLSKGSNSAECHKSADAYHVGHFGKIPPS